MITVMVAAAVVIALVAYLTARFVTGGRGPNSARLAAILVIFIVAWMLIAVRSPSMGAQIAGYGAGGVSEGITGVVNFLHSLIG